jgi:hypothetical protein
VSDGRIAGGPAAGKDLRSIIDQAFASMPPASVGRPADQRVALLERLAALRESGAITPAEFEAEKAKLLAGG